MFEIFNNALFRFVGLIVLFSVPSVVITLVIAKYEGRRRVLKYILPAMLLIVSAACFISAAYTDKTFGTLGYTIFGIILLIPGVAGFITAIAVGAHNKKLDNKKNQLRSRFIYK